MNNKLKIVFCSVFAGLLLWLCVGVSIVAVKLSNEAPTPQWQDVMSVKYLYGDTQNTIKSTFNLVYDTDDAIELSDDVFDYDGDVVKIKDKTIVGKLEDYKYSIELSESNTFPAKTPKIGEFLLYRNGDKFYKVKVTGIKTSYVSVIIKDGVMQVKKDNNLIQVNCYEITYFNN